MILGERAKVAHSNEHLAGQIIPRGTNGELRFAVLALAMCFFDHRSSMVLEAPRHGT